MKIVFLDIDGVLNSNPPQNIKKKWADTYKSADYLMKLDGLDQDIVDNFKYVIDQTDCKIVFSTSWRYYKDHFIVGSDWRKSLSEMLNVSMDIFIDNIPDISFCGGWDSGNYKRRRGDEIKAWLDNNSSKYQIESYCVIDDEIEDIISVIDKKYVIKTDPRYGLTKIDATKVINVLNQERP